MVGIDRNQGLIGGIFLLMLGAALGHALLDTPADATQGEVYRVIYLHVPAAISSFAMAYVLFVASALSFFKKNIAYLYVGRASAEVGLMLTVLTLATGSIWGYPTWGVWWTWDARITTTFLLALLYVGYIMLYDSLPEGARKITACAALGVFVAVDVPIIYKSVTWWRTLHQPPSIVREGGSTMDPTMLLALGLSFLAMILVSGWLVWVRTVNLKLSAFVEQKSFEKWGER